jgi:hypothetical protein
MAENAVTPALSRMKTRARLLVFKSISLLFNLQLSTFNLGMRYVGRIQWFARTGWQTNRPPIYVLHPSSVTLHPAQRLQACE